MERCIPVDKLARPEDYILVSLDKMREARTDQGLTPFNAMPYEEDFLREPDELLEDVAREAFQPAIDPRYAARRIVNLRA